MKRQLSIVLLAVVVCACALRFSTAATISVNVGGQVVEVPTYYIPTSGGGKYGIGVSPTDQEWSWQNAEGKITLMGELDPDPSLGFAASVTDFGAPAHLASHLFCRSRRSYPTLQLSFDSLQGGVTNGGDPDGGVTVTAIPPLGIPVDGDGIPEIQVYTLSDDGGTTWKNVGLDAGPTTFVPLGPFAGGAYGTFNQGPIATIAGGPWTHMRADINFMLSGGGDAFTFSGNKVLTPIPEPSSALLCLLGAVLGGCVRRRS